MQLVSLAAAILPVLFGFMLVRSYGVNLAWADSWNVAPLFQKLESGTLTIDHLLAQHNEHRILFPRIIMLALGRLTRWNSVAEMYLILALTLATLVVIRRGLIDQQELDGGSWWLLPISFLVFSPRQWLNMLWGFQITFALAQLSGVLALYALYRIDSARGEISRLVLLLAAMVGATVSTFSTAVGVLVWFAALPLLLSYPRSSRRTIVAAWGVAACANFAIYFRGYVKPTHHPAISHFISHPLASVDYLLTWMGGSVSGDHLAAASCGLLLLVLSGVAVRLALDSRRLRRNTFWLSLMLWGALAAGAAVITRSALGTDQALDSKYAAFSLLIVIGLFSVLLDLSRAETRGAKNSLTLLTLTLALSALPAYSHALDNGRIEWEKRKSLVPVLLTYRIQSDEELGRIHKSTVVRRGAPILKRLGYNAFSLDTGRPSPSP